MRCPNCFEEKGEAVICPAPSCAFDEALGTAPNCLPLHHLLKDGRYEIGCVLGRPGGFGVAYRTWDNRAGTMVVVKEFLGDSKRTARDPSSQDVQVAPNFHAKYARNLVHFRREAAVIRSIRHENIVRVLETFDSHNTSYFVMPYVQSLDLAQYLKDRPQKRVSDEEAVAFAHDMLLALHQLHKKNLLHCDVKPSNILITNRKQRAILIDFGASRDLTERDPSEAIFSPDYAAPELAFSERGMQLGPWTDIYSLAATLYEALAGGKPTRTRDRMRERPDPLPDIRTIRPDVSEGLARLVMDGLLLEPYRRPQTAKSAREWLPERNTTTDESTTASPAEAAPAPHPELKILIGTFAVTVMLVLLAGQVSENAQFILGVGGFAVTAALAVRLIARRKRERERIQDSVFDISLIGRGGAATHVRQLAIGDSIIVGSSEAAADICIPNNKLSRRHLQLTVTNAGIVEVVDLNSLNHTYMKPPGSPMAPDAWPMVTYELIEEARLMLGDCRDGGVEIEVQRRKK